MDRRADARELLDGPLDDQAAIVGNLRDLRRLNRLFGGVALSRWGVNRLLDGHALEATVLDVGTGGADIPVALLADARRRGRELEVTAVDSRPEIVDAAHLARPGLADVPGLRLAIVGPDELPYADGSFDVAHASLVVHHLDEPRALRFLAELGRVSRGVVVNDLARGRLAWFGTWLATRVLTRNRFTRHDAPVSVTRAYTPGELEVLMRRAGLEPIDRRAVPFGHRYAIVAVPAPSAPEPAPGAAADGPSS
jgi:ubiquinone/menaquinone biosynthesis C-methylase UbiE